MSDRVEIMARLEGLAPDDEAREVVALFHVLGPELPPDIDAYGEIRFPYDTLDAIHMAMGGGPLAPPERLDLAAKFVVPVFGARIARLPPPPDPSAPAAPEPTEPTPDPSTAATAPERKDAFVDARGEVVDMRQRVPGIHN